MLSSFTHVQFVVLSDDRSTRVLYTRVHFSRGGAIYFVFSFKAETSFGSFRNIFKDVIAALVVKGGAEAEKQ